MRARAEVLLTSPASDIQRSCLRALSFETIYRSGDTRVTPPELWRMHGCRKARAVRLLFLDCFSADLMSFIRFVNYTNSLDSKNNFMVSKSKFSRPLYKIIYFTPLVKHWTIGIHLFFFLFRLFIFPSSKLLHPSSQCRVAYQSFWAGYIPDLSFPPVPSFLFLLLRYGNEQ